MHRFLLYDALDSLARGNVMVTLGDLSWGHHLEGVPEVCCVFRSLTENGWVVRLPVTPPDCPLGYWRITPDGQDVLTEGRAWYRSIPPIRRLVARAGIVAPEPRCR